MNPEIPEISNPLTAGKVVGEGITYAVYSRQSVERGHPEYIMGRSELDDFNTCPSKWLAGFESDGSKATEWGTAFDCAVLTPERLKTDYAVCPETYPDSKTGEPKPWTFAANFCKAWREKQGDRTILKAETAKELETAEKALYADEVATEFVLCSKRQVMVLAEYRDKETGLVVPVKALIDLVPDMNHERFGKCLADLKTTTCASPRVWSREVEKYKLHWQGALYLDAWTAATGEDRVDFRHVIVESDPPYQTGRRILSADFIAFGRLGYLGALKRYCQCLKSGEWPDYETQPAMVIDGWGVTELESWMINRE